TKSAEAAKYFCSSGNVTCLIAAINAANENPGNNVINLEPGTYNIEAAIENFNGLPIILRRIEIRASSDTASTVIQRDPNATGFRLFEVSFGGELLLDGIIVRGGVF